LLVGASLNISFHPNNTQTTPNNTMLSRSAFTHLSRGIARQSNKDQLLARAFAAKAGQAEVVLVGCGAPNRGMGWYHAVQMLEGR